MNQPEHIREQQGLQFFGKINASISHEIKNVLAIINENAGLLEDFTLMADKGLPIDPERLKKLSGMIQKQVKRADGIIKNMNAFAHSVDEHVGTVDLGETLTFVSTLTARLTANKGFTLETVPADEPVMLATNPFRLINLIWLSVEFAMDLAGNRDAISISPGKTPAGITLKLSGLEGLTAADPDKIAPDGKLQALLDTCGVTLTVSASTGSFVLIWPDADE